MSLLSFFSVILVFLSENKRSILFSFIPLLIVSSVISSTFFISYNLKYNDIEDKLNTTDLPFVISSKTSFHRNTDGLTNFNDYIRSKIIDSSLDSYISDSGFSSHSIQINFRGTDKNELNETFDYCTIDNSLEKKILSSAAFTGRFPTSSDEVIFISGLNSTINNFEVGQYVNIVVIDIEGDLIFNKSLAIVGKYNTKTIEIEGEEQLSDQFRVRNPIIKMNSLCTSESFFRNVLELYSNKNITYSFNYQYSLKNLETTDLLNFENTFLKLNTFFNSINSFSESETTNSISYYKYFENSNSDYYIFSDLVNLDDYYSVFKEATINTTVTFILLLPSLILALLFAFNTSKIFYTKRKDQISSLRLRTVSNIQLFGLFLVEGLISGVLALIIGFIIGVFFSISTFSFLSIFGICQQFNFPKITINFLVPIWLLFSFFLLSFILFMFLTFRKVDILDTNQKNNHRSLFYRFYLDVIIFIIGTIGYIYFFFLLTSSNSPVGADGQGVSDTLFLISIALLIPFPLLILFGSLMIINRIIPILLKGISIKVWKRYKNLVSYSLLNLIRQKAYIIRIIIFLSFSMSILWICYFIPAFVEHNTVRGYYYQTGAECYAYGDWDESIENQFNQDPRIDGFVQMGGYQVKDNGGNRIDAFILFPGWSEVIYYEEGFINDPIIVEVLLEKNLTVLMDETGLMMSNLGIGEEIKLINEFTSVDLTIIGSFKFWPNLVMKESKINSPKIIMNNETFKTLFSNDFILSSSKYAKGYYLNLSPDTDIDEIYNDYGEDYTISSVYPLINEYHSSHFNTLSKILLSNLFILNAVMILIIFSFSGYHNIRNMRKDFVLESSSGMKQTHLHRILILNSLSILVFSYIIGSILGIFYTIMIGLLTVLLFSSQTLYPELGHVPIVELHLTIILLSVIGLIINYIVTKSICNKRNLDFEVDIRD